MTDWPKVKLGTIADFKNGLNFSNESWGSGLKIIGVSDFKDRMFPDFENLDQINPKGVARDKDLLEQGDVVFVRSNGNRALIGRCLYINELPEPVSHSGFTIRLRFFDRSVIHAPFFVYVFKTDLVRQVLSDFGGGTNINNLNQSILENLEVPLPSFQVQRRVAAILSAYDDLIANNQRRIALLESMAEEIYSEWFVRMRFPGHESVPKAKGLPQGWHLKPFAQVVDINPAERPAKEDEHPFVPMDELSIDSMFFSTSIRRKGSAGSRFRNGDVLFPRITPSLENGKRGFVMCFEDNEVAVGSTEFIVMREHEISAEHIYFLTCSEGFRKHAEISMVGASGRQRVSEGCFSFFLVPVPPDAQRRAFTGLVRPMFKEVGNLSKQNALLAATRDVLLPRLISGKLKVDHLDIQFPPSMREKVTA